MNTTVISGRLVRNPGYNEVENEKGLHKIAKFVLAVRRNYSDEVSFIPVKAFAKKAEFARDYLMQGTKVMVEGEIVTGNYEDKDTGKRSIPLKCMQTGLNSQVQKWLTDHHSRRCGRVFRDTGGHGRGNAV